MITEHKSQDNEQTSRGLENDVPQNRGMNVESKDRKNIESTDGDDIGEPVNNGGVDTTEFDPHLEEQWLAVRDEYLAHYPDLERTDTAYEKGSFNTIIERLAKRRKRTPNEIHKEIMDWPSTK